MRTQTDANKTTNSTNGAKKDPNAPVPTPLEKHLADVAGQPIRPDGSDKYFGFENVSRPFDVQAHGLTSDSMAPHGMLCFHSGAQLATALTPARPN